VKKWISVAVAIILMTVGFAPVMAQDEEPTPLVLSSSTIVVSPDGDTIAYSCVQNGTPHVCLERVLSFGSSNVRLSMRQAIPNGSIAWSPDGANLFYSCVLDGSPYVCLERTLSFGSSRVLHSVRQFASPE